MSWLDGDLLRTKSMLVEERVVAVRVVAADHDRLAMVLRETLKDAGTMIPVGDVLGWTAADRLIETHVQIAPHEEGSSIRVVLRGVSRKRPKMSMYVGLAAAVCLFVWAVLGATGAHGMRLLGFTVLATAVMVGAGVFDIRSYDARVRKMRAAADGLAAALRAGEVPRTRIAESDDASGVAETGRGAKEKGQ